MKKLLFATTAIVAVAALNAPAYADISMSGSMKQQIGMANNEEDSKVAEFATFDIQSDSEIAFKYTTSLDNGIKISGAIELEGDGAGIDESSFTIQGDFGSVMIGANDGSGDDFADKPSRGDIGNHDNYIVSRGLNNALGDNAVMDQSGDHQKIKYTTPNLGGLKMGVSYTPEMAQGGGGSMANRVGDASSEIEFGMQYSFDMDGTGVDLAYAFGKEGGDGSTATEGRKGHHASVITKFGDFKAGVAYGRVMGSHESADDDGRALQAGISYSAGAMGVGVYHQKTSTEQAAGGGEDTRVVNGVFLDYDVADGVKFSSAIFNDTMKAGESGVASSTFNTGGWGLIGGLKVSF
jgi:outer membrane protein OmpU